MENRQFNPENGDHPLLQALFSELQELRQEAEKQAEQRLARFMPYLDRSVGNTHSSASNLAYYLALRSFDLRPLQDRLARVGLSSLGRGEADIRANLDAVIELLKCAITGPSQQSSPPWYEENLTGTQFLEQNTDALFGPVHRPRNVRIMVTLATEAAYDYGLVLSLIKNGMDCARINCAHDDPEHWLAMIEKVRRASSESSQQCRILMDLGGHKLRTGAIESGPAILHLSVPKNIYGHKTGPAEILIERDDELARPNDTSAGKNRIGLPADVYSGLQSGDRLDFVDSRGKRRQLEVIKRLASGQWRAHCHKTAYLTDATPVSWQRVGKNGKYCRLEQSSLSLPQGPAKVIRLFKDDAILLDGTDQPGRPARYDEKGHLLAPARIGCTLPNISTLLTPGDPVWIDDGKLGAIVEARDSDSNAVLLRVTHANPKGVKIQSDKGLNFPGVSLNLPSLSRKDLEDLDFICEHADMVGFSFVESLADMEVLSKELGRRGVTELPIIAKIETDRAVRNLPEIILGSIGRHRLGIMIARGDLAVELGSARLAEIQEELLWLCEAAHVPVIWATQVLESMAKKGVRSRPEFTDAAMGVRAECVMLNKGPFIPKAVQALSDVLERMEGHQRKKFSRLRALHW